MPAFSDKQTGVLLQSISTMYDHHERLERCPVTADDLMSLYVKPEDHDVCRRAKDLFDSLYGGRSLMSRAQINDSVVEFSVALGKDVPFLLPNYARAILDTSSNESRVRLIDWVAERYQLSMTYGRIKQLFEHLNVLCAVPAQVKFLWPSIEVLASIAEEKNKDVPISDKLNSGTRKSLPFVSPELREACRETATTIAMWQMLPEPPPRDTLGVQVTIGGGFGARPQGSTGLGRYYGL